MSADASDDEDNDGKSATVEVDGEQVIVRVRCAECLKKGLTTEADENLGQFYESQLRDDLLCASHYLEELRTLENNYVMKIGKN